MKKITASIFLCIFFVSAIAQNSNSSKKQTEKFIKKTLSQVIGKKYRSVLIVDQAFNSNFSELKTTKKAGGESTTIEYKNINWADVSYFETGDHYYDNDVLVPFIVNFKAKNIEHTSYGTIDEEKVNFIIFYIPFDKLESCKNAFTRLAVITAAGE